MGKNADERAFLDRLASQVAPRQRWMPKSEALPTWQGGRVIERVCVSPDYGAGYSRVEYYHATDKGVGSLSWLLENFSLCRCAVEHRGPCSSAAVAAPPASPCPKPWCGTPREYQKPGCFDVHGDGECFGPFEMHYCSNACAQKREKATPTAPDLRWVPVQECFRGFWWCSQKTHIGEPPGPTATMALPNVKPDGTWMGGAGACAECWKAGRREPLDGQRQGAMPPGDPMPEKPPVTVTLYRFSARTDSDIAGVAARAHIPSTQAGCLLGCKCPIHRPPREPYIPAIDDFDLLPDA